MTTILLVDDDPLQSSLMISVLRRRFDDVFRATDASEALCLIEQPEFADKLGLVISGHHTRGIGGPAFVAELRSRMPALPVLVLGAAGEVPGDYAAAHIAFLPRPVVPEVMLALTDRMLTQNKNAVA